MEVLFVFMGLKVLLTTGADYSEIQAPTLYDQADVVISVDSRGATVLKGERPCYVQ